jgi:hypothetical protein
VVGASGGGYVSAAAGQAGNFSLGHKATLTEGKHTLSLFGDVTSGTTGTLASTAIYAEVRG